MDAAGKTDGAGGALLLEALAHGARLVVELATSPVEPRDADLAVFQSFAVGLAARVARPAALPAAWAAALPSLALAAHCALVARTYEGVALVAAGLAYAPPS